MSISVRGSSIPFSARKAATRRGFGAVEQVTSSTGRGSSVMGGLLLSRRSVPRGGGLGKGRRGLAPAPGACYPRAFGRAREDRHGRGWRRRRARGGDVDRGDARTGGLPRLRRGRPAR